MSVSRVLVVLGAALALSGCATPIKSSAIVAVPAAQVHGSGSDVSLLISGGQRTSPVHWSRISDDAFASALKTSIEKSQLFAQARVGGEARYQLNAYLANIDSPDVESGTAMRLEVGYALTDAQTQKKLWSASIVGIHITTRRDALAVTDRARLALEGAARETIQKMIEQVSALNLP